MRYRAGFMAASMLAGCANPSPVASRVGTAQPTGEMHISEAQAESYLARRSCAALDPTHLDACMRRQIDARHAAPQAPEPPRPDDPRLNQAVETLIAADQDTWLVDRLVPGSVRNSRVLSLGPDQRIAEVASEFRVRGEPTDDPSGTVGKTALIRLANGQMQCVVYSDHPGVCKKPGEASSAKQTAEAVAVIAGLLAVASVASGASHPSQGLVAYPSSAGSAGGGPRHSMVTCLNAYSGNIGVPTSQGMQASWLRSAQVRSECASQ